MISILNSLNENIVTLVGKLKVRVFLENNEEKENGKDRIDEETKMYITYS